MTLTTPPVDCPNSASYPPVFTCTSLMKSNGVALPREPNTIEYEPSAPYPWLVTLTPSITYWFSRPLPPEIDGFAVPALPLVLTPGAMYSVSLTRRPTGTRLNMSLDSTAPVVVDVVSTIGELAVTWTV